MTPLALELEGFTCYRQRTSIRWDGSDTALFAVTGPTGAGKSTLLDAITYVLYGRTARLGSKGLASLISPGLDSLFVQLTFRTARGVFRATRAAQRRTAGVGTEVRIELADPAAPSGWRQLTESERVKDANQELQEIVGLDYDGFTRAVLLPQGAFDEFLRGDAKLRRQLLSSLLGLDRVEQIQQLASSRAAELKGQADARRTVLQGEYAAVTPQAVTLLKHQVQQLAAAAEERAAQVLSSEQQLTAVTRVADLLAERREVARRRQALRDGAAEVTQKRQRLQSARRAAAVAPQAENWQRARARAAEADGKATAAAQQLQAAAEALAAATTAQRRLVAESQASRAAQQRQLQALTDAMPAVAALQQRGGRLEDATKPGSGTSAEPLDEQRWAGWQTALSLVTPFDRAVSQQRRAAAGAQQADRKLEQLTASAQQLDERLQAAIELGKRLRAADAEAQQAVQRAQRADLAATLRQGLRPGDPCPVCGGPMGQHAHPAPGGGQLAAATQAAADAAAALQGGIDRFQELSRQHAQAEAARDGARVAQQEARTALLAAADAARAAADDLRRHGAQPGLPDAAGNYAEQAGAKLRTDLQAALDGALAAHARAVIHRLDEAGVPKQDQPRLERRQAQLQQQLQEHEQRLQAAERSTREAQAAHEGAADRLALANENAALFGADAQGALAALQRAVDAAGFKDPQEAAGAELPAPQLARLEAEVAAHDQEVDGLERRDIELAASLAAQPALPAPPADYGGAPQDAAALADYLQGALNEQRAALRRQQEELGGARNQLATLQGQLERSVQLRRELTALDDQHTLYHQLNTDLHGHRFPEHLLTQVQQLLARRASSILQHVTDGRYDLRLADGDYLVADAWAGGEMRSARTLSGGESFVASLALALALSDTLAGNAALGALFLDEGFGTLDRETLEAVTSVLESLTDEGRMVGVITHVQGLSERLPARLLVRKGPGGSTVAWDA